MEEGLDGTVARNFASEFGAHEFRTWKDAGPANVEPVGIPAGPNGRIIVTQAIGMAHASIAENLETGVGKVEGRTTKSRSVLRAACAVALVPTIVFAATVMEQGKEPDNDDIRAAARSEQEAIALDTAPMIGAVDGITRRLELPCKEVPGAVNFSAFGCALEKDSSPCRGLQNNSP